MTATATAEPCCGKCGYSVRGLDSFTCPECGSDLREVGILTDDRRRFTRPIIHAALWTLVLPIAALAASSFLMHFALPVVREQHLQRVVFCQYPQLNATFTIKQDGRKTSWGGERRNVVVPVTAMTITTGQDVDHQLHVNLITRGYDFLDSAGRTVSASSGFNAAALLRWLSTQGFNATDPLVGAGAADVITCIDEIPTGQGRFSRFSVRNSMADITAHPTWSYTMIGVSPWTTISLTAFWILVWVAGIRAIVRRSRTAPGR